MSCMTIFIPAVPLQLHSHLFSDNALNNDVQLYIKKIIIICTNYT